MEPPEDLRTILDLTQDKVVVVDSDGHYQYANAATERILGYDIEAFVGTNTFEYIHPEDREEVQSTFERLVDINEELIETATFRHRAADGSWIWFESRMWNRADPDLDGYVVSSRDVTARLAAERRQHEAETQLRRLAKHTDDVLWMFSADWGNVHFLNEAFEDIWGMSRETLIDEPWRFLERVHTDDRPDVKRAMEQLSDGAAIDIEYRVERDRSFQSWVWVKGHPIVEGGEVTRVVGFARDITNRRRRERQLRVLDNLLRHNLRNVLNVVLGHADLARQRAGPEVEAGMDAITSVATELLTTVEKERRIVELLVESPGPSPIDISTLLSDLVADARRSYPEASVTLDCSTAQSVFAIPEIRHAIAELLENAIVHACGRAAIEIRARSRSDHVSIRIEDTAPPIPRNEFEPLFSSRNPSELYHGTGLGLWLVYWAVDLSNGELGFGRTPKDDGNVVTVRLQTVR
ncbi:MAG: PAS domain S-box protein [Natronomonas sp.]|uniref:PAS domain-containing sensor histidine kinase n=1 Tax=Natronomonas sp. TaxID=2184060 RepID=UPI0028703200|nr:PAS domain S-box protein [Natronomonas sp.]MDR9429563.1 PAS domain S-box protein [Natronomonas sp.]